ncbi:SDR family NAD(P)-dependent oxidoreductase (plasmid) [Pseudoalteromonas xiamenensis]|uniref:SDR family NAD(P)-dependent oxidoreductase n=1 Tax=Pseudoalteromonas xiamenensis TaxID=882626 RepID=UPI0027E44C7B|nr:SDR family NAD(P)-dependent oxidoreductase [Pseudoalteromonas xiamenensis]WMN62142.1 SDR family NAD(P)-dependent oxidoreductase [Pseudoalteromonas xiamenensis]
MNILITGASSGIGLALTNRLAKSHNVIACGRNQNKLDTINHDKNVTTLAFDVSVKKDVENASKNIEQLDWLILNAGTCEYIDNPARFDSALFERVINANLISVAYCLEFFMPKLKDGGKLIIMSSSSMLLPLPRAEAYGASKAALTYLAKTLETTLEHLDVTVVHPGFVATPLTQKNDFPMPFIIDVDDAATRIIKGVVAGQRTIEFPKRLIWIMKCLSYLPQPIWRSLARRMKK